MSVGLVSFHLEHVKCSVEPQWCVLNTLCCRLLRPLAPHPHSCFRGPSRMTRMSHFTPVTSWKDQDGKFTNYSIQTVAIFLIRTSMCATLCQDAQCGNGSLSAKRGFVWHFINDKIILGRFWGEHFIAKLFRGNFYMFWFFQCFS